MNGGRLVTEVMGILGYERTFKVRNVGGWRCMVKFDDVSCSLGLVLNPFWTSPAWAVSSCKMKAPAEEGKSSTYFCKTKLACRCWQSFKALPCNSLAKACWKSVEASSKAACITRQPQRSFVSLNNDPCKRRVMAGMVLLPWSGDLRQATKRSLITLAPCGWLAKYGSSGSKEVTTSAGAVGSVANNRETTSAPSWLCTTFPIALACCSPSECNFGCLLRLSSRQNSNDSLGVKLDQGNCNQSKQLHPLVTKELERLTELLSTWGCHTLAGYCQGSKTDMSISRYLWVPATWLHAHRIFTLFAEFSAQ